ncbi:hypothetical protein [Isoalcanivorax indicus]|uniref:hypothetical protein n=1 Tax=Isoalcanivorax indicus TaxID=2202653 RepID=UPI001B8643C6|nr:hypothetical protein [Isoalcanivorax indicus]
MHKLARYSLSLAELFGTDRVVPVVVFLNRPRRAPESIVLGNEFFDYLRFRYIRCVLPDMPAEHYLESPNIVARLTLPTMRWPPELKLAIYASAIRGLDALEHNPDKRAKYTTFVDIYTCLDNNERMIFEQHYQQEATTMTGFAERFREQGLERGLEQGLERGLREARVATARKLIQKTRLDNASIADVTELPEAEVQALRSESETASQHRA